MPRKQDVQSRVANAATLGLVGSLFGRTGTVAGVGLGALGVGPFSARRGGGFKGGSRRWIADALRGSTRGRFSKIARANKMSTQDFACHVLKSSNYDTRTRREAQMFVNMNRSRKCSGRRVRGGANQFDAEIIAEASKPKLYDFGTRLRSLKDLASREGIERAKSIAASPIAKKILQRR
jgi:hypothetical protein